jgi:tryptophan halogenase
MKIKSIMVVGGGSSGWMTAAALSKKFGKDIKISVLEGENSNPVGVGESTITKFNTYLNLLELEDKEWMPHCNATYKTSIRFTNFRDGKGEVFEYPFAGSHTEESFGSWSVIRAKYKLGPDSFCEFLNHAYWLAKHNRMTDGNDFNMSFSLKNDTAYHFDASLFGKFLKTRFCKKANHYIDDVVAVKKDEEGYITSLVGNSGTEYSADLYVDCTGFKSLLLEKEMGSEFISFKPWLDNNRAIATHLPYKDKTTEIRNVTNCTALNSGWSWNIPLWNRMGSGYVYSSDFISDDDAEKEFKQHVGNEDIEIRKINIRHGVRERGWVKNVVGVGLSYGFIEPLESTGLVSTHEMIDQLVETLDRRKCNITGFDRDSYNYTAQLVVSGYMHFVSLHYKLSQRSDTPYWKYQTELKDWFKLSDPRLFTDRKMHFSYENGSTSFYENIHQMHSLAHRWDPEKHGIAYIMAGMGHVPYADHLYHYLRNGSKDNFESDIDKTYQEYKKCAKIMEENILTLPTSYEFLKENIYS